MVRRIFLVLISTVALQGTVMAADFGGPGVPAAQMVPGADVTIERGVRVIRPVPFDPAWVVEDETPIPGGLVYRGAAFYRVPSSSKAKAVHRAKPVTPEKPQAE